MFHNHPILQAIHLMDSDSYKFSHWGMYPQEADWMMSYFESRGGEQFKSTVPFGLQYLIKEYLTRPLTHKHVDLIMPRIKAHGLPYHEKGFREIADLGYWPVKIRAVPEGTPVPKGNALMTVESSEKATKNTFWAVSWLETMLVRLWSMQNVATLSFEIRKRMKSYLQETTDLTGEALEGTLDFMLHNFGSRGDSCMEGAGTHGMAHMAAFKGTDTVVALAFAEAYYGAEVMPAFSVNASEHSVMSMMGPEGEIDTTERIIDKYLKPNSILSVVGDTYDIQNFCLKILGHPRIKEKIKNSGGKFVCRPDSGVPWVVSTQVQGWLVDVFGSETNSKGYKQLPPYIGALYGDGINYTSIGKMLKSGQTAGFASSNLVFGMGGALVAKHDRDTHRMAFKCCAARVDGEYREVRKNPKTDSGKSSKGGRLDLIPAWNEKGIGNGEKTFETVKLDPTAIQHGRSAMDTVFEDGKLLKEYTLEEIRARLRSWV